MKSIQIILLSLLVVILSGCVSSENGFCSADERGAFFDPAIQGEWALFSCQNGPLKKKRFDGINLRGTALNRKPIASLRTHRR